MKSRPLVCAAALLCLLSASCSRKSQSTVPQDAEQIHSVATMAPAAQVATNVTNGNGSVRKVALVSEFIGKLATIDKQNQTVSIVTGDPGTKPDVFILNSDTKTYSGDAPAALDDSVLGQYVRYNARKEDGKLFLTVLRWSPGSNQKKQTN